jgi:hypothetical protein
MNLSPNRKQRRAYLKATGIIKAKNDLSFKEWSQYTSENQKKGAEIHAKNVDFYDKQVYEQLQEKENSMVKFWQENGFNQKQIDTFLDDWHQTIFRNRDKKAKPSEA